MPNEFLQTSDIHIGESRKIPDYITRHTSVLWQILGHAQRDSLPLVIPGDLFHTKNPNFEERLLADRFIGECERSRVHTIITAGNHDHLYGAVTLLDGYKQYPLQYVKIVGWEPEVHRIGDVAFICISWGNKTKDQIRQIVLGLLPQTVGAKYRVCMVHECIVGSKFDNGIVSPKGSSLPKISDIDYWAVGDIHTHQLANLPNAFYAGAPLQFKFDDQECKGYLVVDLERPTKPAFYETSFRKLRIVERVADITDDAYYMVRGEIDEVLKGNKLDNVIRTGYQKAEKSTIAYRKLSITDGLPEFLALNGFDKDYQDFALKWVSESLLNEI